MCFFFPSSSIELTRNEVNSSSPIGTFGLQNIYCLWIHLQKQRVNLIKMGRDNNGVMMQCFTSHLFCRSVLCPEVFAIFSLSLSQHASIIVIMWNTFLCFPVWYQAVIWHPRWDENLQNNYLLQNSNHLTAVSYWEMKLWKK